MPVQPPVGKVRWQTVERGVLLASDKVESATTSTTKKKSDKFACRGGAVS